MRYLFISILLLIFASALTGQTLEETELWIVNVIESHQLTRQNKTRADVVWKEITTEVDFANPGYLFISEIRYYKTKHLSTLHWSHIIPVKHMKSISYRIEDEYVEVEFSIRLEQSGGQNLILRETYGDNGLVSESDNVEKLSIVLSRTFLNENLSRRFRKAVDHLIVLNGGNVE